MQYLQAIASLLIALSCPSKTTGTPCRPHSISQSAFQSLPYPIKRAITTQIPTKQPFPFKSSSLIRKLKGSVLELEKEKDSNNESFQLYTENLDSSEEVKRKSTGVLLNAFALSIFTVSSLAYYGFLSVLGQDPNVYTVAQILRDAGATLFATVSAGIFVKVLTTASKNGKLNPKDSRKILHSLSGPLFLFCWPLYSSMSGARFFAAIVPLLFGLRLFIAGNKNKNYGDETELAKAVSRSGDVKEALQGPLVYSIILLVGVLAFWNSNLNGIVGISVMAAGDGAADIVGRRFGKNNKWSFNNEKSIAGTLAFFISSLLTTVGLVYWLHFTSFVNLPISHVGNLVTRLSAICGLSSLVEVIPGGDDNWTVPISAIMLSYIFLR